VHTVMSTVHVKGEGKGFLYGDLICT